MGDKIGVHRGIVILSCDDCGVVFESQHRYARYARKEARDKADWEHRDGVDRCARCVKRHSARCARDLDKLFMKP